MRTVALLIVSIFFYFNSYSNNGVAAKNLILKLKSGGYVVYFRHDKTEKKQIDKGKIDVREYQKRKEGESCMTQRNLSTSGVESVKRIGQFIKQNKIDTSTVLSSPFCRCYDSARFVSGINPKVSNSLFFSLKATYKEKKESGAALRNLLNTKVPQGKNVFLFSHTSNLKEAANIWPKVEGAAYVFKSGNGNEAKFLGVILPEEWR